MNMSLYCRHAAFYYEIRNWIFKIFFKLIWGKIFYSHNDRDLVVRVPGYRSRGPGSISGATNFVSTIQELLEKKSSGSVLERREYDSRDSWRWPHGTLYPQKLALTSPTSGGCSVGIVHSWTQATDFFSF
jgi:hypothetical protein